ARAGDLSRRLHARGVSLLAGLRLQPGERWRRHELPARPHERGRLVVLLPCGMPVQDIARAAHPARADARIRRRTSAFARRIRTTCALTAARAPRDAARVRGRAAHIEPEYRLPLRHAGAADGGGARSRWRSGGVAAEPAVCETGDPRSDG